MDFAQMPTWPSRRNLARYSELTRIDIREFLQNGGTWIDIGPGPEATAVSELVGVPQLDLVVLDYFPLQLPAGIRCFQGEVPKCRDFAAMFQKVGTFVSDIYGGVSYADDPLEALLFESLLPAEEGKLACFTELERFGDSSCWARVEELFAILGQVATLEVFRTFADANQVWEEQLRISLAGASSSSIESWDTLVQLAREVVGVGTKDKVLWQSKDPNPAVIYRVNYSR